METYKEVGIHSEVLETVFTTKILNKVQWIPIKRLALLSKISKEKATSLINQSFLNNRKPL